MRTAKAVVIFFVCGFVSGLCFGILLSAPSLTTFWYIKGNKFLIPTYRYYLGVGIFMFLGLAAAYTISRITGLLHDNSSLIRKIVSAIIVTTSPVILFAVGTVVETQTATSVATATGTMLLTNIDPITLYIWGFVAFVLLISIACWILSAKLYYIGVVLNLLTLPSALGLLYVLSKVVTGNWPITHPVYFSLLCASCGFWIATVHRVNAS